MKDELWMRTWNDGHPRFSDDLHRGLLWLLSPFRRLGKAVAAQVAGEEGVLARAVARRGKRPRRAR